VTTGFPTDSRRGIFEDIVALAPQHPATPATVRAMVAGLHPDATVQASRREPGVCRGFGIVRRATRHACAMPRRAHVMPGFLLGIRRPDPGGLLEGTGQVLRHLKRRHPDDARRPAVTALLAAGIEARRAALTPDQGR
jgi:hypothetical protein